MAVDLQWYELPENWKVNFADDMSGLTHIPQITADMIEYVPGHTEMREQGYGDGDSQMVEIYVPGSYQFTAEAKEALDAGGTRWSGVENNIEWFLGIPPEEVEYYRQAGWDLPEGYEGGINPQLKVKTADRGSMNLNFTPGQDGSFKILNMGDQYWNTKGMEFKDVAKGVGFVLASTLGAGLLAEFVGPYIAATFGNSAFAGMSAAEIATMIEAGTVGAEGLAMEFAAVPGLQGFLNGTLTATQFLEMNPGFDQFISESIGPGDGITNSGPPADPSWPTTPGDLGEWPTPYDGPIEQLPPVEVNPPPTPPPADLPPVPPVPPGGTPDYTDPSWDEDPRDYRPQDPANDIPDVDIPGGPELPDLSKLPQWVKDLVTKYGPGVLASLPDLVTGIISTDQGEDAIDDRLARELQAAGDYKQAGLDYAQGIRDLIPGLEEAYKYKPVNITSGFGSTSFDPETGALSYTLSAPYQDRVDSMLGLASGVRDQLGDADPKRIAKERFDEWLALQAPSREAGFNQLLNKNYASGRMGLSVNTPTQLGVVGTNPLANSYYAQLAQADAQGSYDSMNWAQKYIDDLIAREGMLFGNAANTEKLGYNMMTDAFNFGNTLTNSNRSAADAVFGANRDALAAERQAVQDYINAQLGYQNKAAGADAANRTMITDTVGTVVKNLPWKDIFNGLFG